MLALVESIFKEMKRNAEDFSAIPGKFRKELEDLKMDSRTVLEQVKVLRVVAGFGEEIQNRTPTNKNNSTNSSENSQSLKKDSPSQQKPSSSSSSNSTSEDWKKSLEDTTQLRRKKYIESLQSNKGNSTENAGQSLLGKERVEDKWKRSCPLNFFLTTVRSIANEKPGVLSVSFKGLHRLLKVFLSFCC
jgi:cobalamin biosynthesis protein CobT